MIVERRLGAVAFVVEGGPKHFVPLYNFFEADTEYAQVEKTV
jgi:hypothetical protein